MTVEDTDADPPLFTEPTPQRYAMALCPDERYGQVVRQVHAHLHGPDLDLPAVLLGPIAYITGAVIPIDGGMTATLA
jgi:hypothetical protein